MSTTGAEAIVPVNMGDQRRAILMLSAAALIAVAGLAFCFAFQWAGLWRMWFDEPLRSIGLAIPPASLFLAVRAWRLEDWSRGGSWWGLPLVLAALLLALASPAGLYTLLHLTVQPAPGYPNIIFAPTGLLLYGYVSGVVLLFGGAHAWRKAWFPLSLLLFVDPVPHSFQALVDLPLQQFAAHSARGFAALINVPVSEGTLRMMFTPQLGMFIAPGCDGLRGAVAMGYMALVIGYLYRLRWARWAIYVVSAVVLAYLFNLLRLCAVVVYYWVALRLPAIAHHATLADYIIGGALFFCAALFLFSLPRRWRPSCTPSSPF